MKKRQNPSSDLPVNIQSYKNSARVISQDQVNKYVSKKYLLAHNKRICGQYLKHNRGDLLMQFHTECTITPASTRVHLSLYSGAKGSEYHSP